MRWGILGIVTMAASAVQADAPVVEGVRVTGTGTVHVTLSHPDTGWDHFADGWEVLDEDGNRIGFRELLHPHVEEQPFTRSLSGVKIPEGATAIYIRARCSVDGWNEETVRVELP